MRIWRIIRVCSQQLCGAGRRAERVSGTASGTLKSSLRLDEKRVCSPPFLSSKNRRGKHGRGGTFFSRAGKTSFACASNASRKSPT